MPTYNLIEYSDNYLKTSGNLWQFCKDILVVNYDGNIIEFNGANAADSFDFKARITGQTGNNGRIDGAKIIVPLKYLRNFWRTLEMHKDAQRTSRKKYYLPNVEIKDFNVMIDGKSFLINQ